MRSGGADGTNEAAAEQARGLWYEEFTIGREFATSARTVSVADISNFAALSGDFHPQHVDEEYCRGTAYGTRTAHGLLVLAMAVGLISRLNLIEGTGVAFLGFDRIQFVKPVRPGDTLQVRIRVVECRETSRQDRGVVKRLTEVINQRNEVVQQSIMIYLMSRRPQGDARCGGGG